MHLRRLSNKKGTIAGPNYPIYEKTTLKLQGNVLLNHQFSEVDQSITHSA